MTTEIREFMKGGANIHVKAHYRMHDGKLIYVAAHDKMGAPVGTEAQLHERVQHGKNKAHLMTIDPEDRDTVLKHAGQLGLKPEVKYQGGKIRDHQGNVKAHGFHYLKFDSEEDAAKVHASISASSKGEAVDTPAPSEPEQPEDKVGTHPNDAVKQAQDKLQSFINIGHATAIQHALSGTLPAEKGIELADQGLELANAAISAAEAYEKETGEPAPSAKAFKGIAAKLESWKQQLQEKVKPAEAAQPEEKPASAPKMATPKGGKGGKSELGGALGVISAIKKHSITQFPSGKWGFVGAVPHQLLYRHEDGSPLSDKEAGEMQQSQNPSMTAKNNGFKKMVFDSKEGALAFAKSEGFPVDGAEDEKKGEEPTGLPDPKEDAQGQITAHMADAEKNFHADPKAAVDALRKAAELAEKHGVGYTHAGNGKSYDAAWMKKMADDMEAALPKPQPVDEKYTQAAKKATDLSSDAHEGTKGLTADKANGEHTPEKAKMAYDGHVDAGTKHVLAKMAHQQAAEHAPTPELASFHAKKAQEHDQHATVHSTAAGMHHKQHLKNQAQENYDSELAKADAETQTADDHTAEVGKLQDHEKHADAATLHESAAKAHTGMIQHALANDDEQAANEHASIATHHQKKAAYHKAASAAWKETHADKADHGKAAQLHSEASKAAKDAGVGTSDGHDNYAKAHAEKSKTPAQKKAEEASDEAKDWSWQPHMDGFQHAQAAKAHKAAEQAHNTAANHAHSKGDSETGKHHDAKIEHHAAMADYHGKAASAASASDEANQFHGVEHKHTSSEHEAAAKSHEKAAKEHEALAQHPGIKDSQKHQGYHSEAALHHQDMAEKHKKFAASQKSSEEEDAAGDAAAAKPQPARSSANPWKGKDHKSIEDMATKAELDGDHASAIKHYKHAAVVAHHNGNAKAAKMYADAAKELMASSIKKAVDTGSDTVLELDPRKIVVAIQSAAVLVHREKLQVRNMLKAVDTLPSFDKLQRECAKATKAGITGIDEIVAHALGGRKQAAPYLAFLAQVNQ